MHTITNIHRLVTGLKQQPPHFLTGNVGIQLSWHKPDNVSWITPSRIMLGVRGKGQVRAPSTVLGKSKEREKAQPSNGGHDKHHKRKEKTTIQRYAPPSKRKQQNEPSAPVVDSEKEEIASSITLTQRKRKGRGTFHRDAHFLR